MSDHPVRAGAADSIEVVIGGRRYKLRGDDTEVLKALAARVDETLARVAGPGGPRDDFKIAVLAALNLAGDHEDRRASWLQSARAIAHRARELEARLEGLSRP